MKHTLKAELIIFDLDGTLIDSPGDIAWAVNRTLEGLGREVVDTETVKSSVGWGVRQLLENLMPGEDPQMIDEARGVFLEYYGGHLDVETHLYAGVVETLEHFNSRGKLMALVTNKPVSLTGKVLEAFAVSGFFAMVLGGDSLPRKKPHPEPLLKVVDDLQVPAERTVFVGDSAIDCETGKRAGIVTIGAAYGFRGRGELVDAGCGMIIESLDELKEIVV